MDGAITLFKPSGITSFKAAGQVKRITGVKKCGHGGTLDPIAEGVLPVFLGEATKVIPFLENNEKSYIATIKLGIITDTMDCEGNIISEDKNSIVPSLDEVQKILALYKGEILQKPPMYSAVKYKGRRLYEYARKKIEVDRKDRKVRIDKIDIIFYDFPFLKINVNCSSGTYIRSLADEIGKKLGCGGHIAELLRTKSGDFGIAEAVSIDTLKSESKEEMLDKHIKGIDDMLSGLAEVEVSDELKKRLLNGMPFSMDEVVNLKGSISEKQLCKVKDSGNNVFAIAQSFSVGYGATGSETNFVFKIKRLFN